MTCELYNVRGKARISRSKSNFSRDSLVCVSVVHKNRSPIDEQTLTRYRYFASSRETNRHQKLLIAKRTHPLCIYVCFIKWKATQEEIQADGLKRARSYPRARRMKLKIDSSAVRLVIDRHYLEATRRVRGNCEHLNARYALEICRKYLHVPETRLTFRQIQFIVDLYCLSFNCAGQVREPKP